MQKSKLRAYARLIARKGVNIKKGQDVVINAELDQPEFICILTDECYKAGAGKVEVQWNHQPLEKISVRHESLKRLSEITDWQKARFEHRVNTLPAMIHVISEDPDGLSGINIEKFSKASAKRRAITKPYRERMENKYQWCVVAVPGVKWAKKLFPGLRASIAVEKLWEVILSASRADVDPMAQWDEHNADLKARCDRLNSLGITSLHYRSSNGTDLTIGLVPGTKFLGGADPTTEGVFFNANIPSEEVFTSPMRGKADGKVVASMPLSYQGQLIENFWLVFKDGKAVEYHAEKNEELLGKMLNMDDGASYLGECALVPYDSPIRKTGILFYNTLFDENAACHLALGNSYPETLVGFENMTHEEYKERGLNSSIIHEDFMIGTADLDIDAVCADGKTVPIFRNGNWA
ncbi:MAG: aminopeptidase [Clostridia bacterium]|nr:aminopeptidase [Clostridia bacterium]